LWIMQDKTAQSCSACRQRNGSKSRQNSPTQKQRQPAKGGCGSTFLQRRNNRRKGGYPLFSPSHRAAISGFVLLAGLFGPSHGPQSKFFRGDEITVSAQRSKSNFLHRGLCFVLPLGHAMAFGSSFCARCRSKILVARFAWSFSPDRRWSLYGVQCGPSRKVD